MSEMKFPIRLGFAALAVLSALAGAACSDGDSKPRAATTPTGATSAEPATATPLPESPTATPLPAGLSPAVRADGPVTVWVYAGTPATANCDDLVAFMLPVELFGSATPREKSVCQPGNARYLFLQDSSATFYLEAVEILPIGLPSLPDRFDSRCESIVRHLVPATADPATAKFVLVCNDRIPPRGSAPKTIQIWVRLVKGLAPAIPLDPTRPCWETSRYLGGATEAETVEVRCTLDE